MHKMRLDSSSESRFKAHFLAFEAAYLCNLLSQIYFATALFVVPLFKMDIDYGFIFPNTVWQFFALDQSLPIAHLPSARFLRRRMQNRTDGREEACLYQ